MHHVVHLLLQPALPLAHLLKLKSALLRLVLPHLLCPALLAGFL